MGAREPATHEGHGHEEEKAQIAISTVSGERAQRLPDGAIFCAQDSAADICAANAGHRKRRAQEGHRVLGRIIPDPNASGYVQSAVGGRLPQPRAAFPDWARG